MLLNTLRLLKSIINESVHYEHGVTFHWNQSCDLRTFDLVPIHMEIVIICDLLLMQNITTVVQPENDFNRCRSSFITHVSHHMRH
jgi:hypothetical protein